MQIIVLANNAQKTEILSKPKHKKAEIVYIDHCRELADYKNADACFMLTEKLNIQQIKSITQPLFIHEVIIPLAGSGLPKYVSRINAWPTFLQRDLWEVAAQDEAMAKNVFKQIGWKYLAAADEPGLISARILAMIINEAYLTFEEKISTKQEIDTAMKLGTNYPYGPFEWAEKIGLHNIQNLLTALRKEKPGLEISATIEKELAGF